MRQTLGGSTSSLPAPYGSAGAQTPVRFRRGPTRKTP
nr:MAG TPA: hypothetical protein [Caudoviricetes sp.]